MAITVYWAPFGEPTDYSKQFLSYRDPIKVLDSLKLKKNSTNKIDNFFNCPAFVNSIKNTYMFTSPTDANLTFSGNQIINNLNPDQFYDRNIVVPKQESMQNAFTVRYNANWLMFSEESVHIHTTPPYLHNSSVTNCGYYVPGTFDISAWFRPFEYAFQMWEGQTQFTTTQDDPLLYVTFLTDEPIILKKFYLSDELYKLSMSCVRLKNYRREKNLLKLYDIFNASKLRSRILKEIKNNLL
jgi:hypothetical protein